MKRQNFGDGYLRITRSHGDERMKVKLQTPRNGVWHEINFTITACHISDIADQIHSVLNEWQHDLNAKKKSMRGEE